MLELELQLIPFVRDHFSSLTEQEQRCWYAGSRRLAVVRLGSGSRDPADPVVRQVVEKIMPRLRRRRVF